MATGRTTTPSKNRGPVGSATNPSEKPKINTPVKVSTPVYTKESASVSVSFAKSPPPPVRNGGDGSATREPLPQNELVEVSGRSNRPVSSNGNVQPTIKPTSIPFERRTSPQETIQVQPTGQFTLRGRELSPNSVSALSPERSAALQRQRETESFLGREQRPTSIPFERRTSPKETKTILPEIGFLGEEGYGPRRPATTFQREMSGVESSYDIYGERERIPKNVQRTQEYFENVQKEKGGDKKAAVAILGYEAVQGTKQTIRNIPAAGAFAVGGAFAPVPTAIIGTGLLLGSVPSIQREIGEKGVARTIASEAPSFALFGGAGKLGSKFGPKLTGSPSYAKFNKELIKEEGFGLPRPVFKVTSTEVPKGEDIGIAITKGKGERITTIEFPTIERTTTRRTLPKVQKKIGIEATKEDVVKVGIENIGGSDVNIIQVGKIDTAGYLQSGVMRGKEFAKLSDVYSFKRLGTPTAETRASRGDIEPFESFNIISKKENVISFGEVDTRVGIFGKGFPKLGIEQGKSPYVYNKFQFTQKAKPSIGGIESTSLFKGTLVRFPRERKTTPTKRSPKEKDVIDLDKLDKAFKSDENLIGGVRYKGEVRPVTQSSQQLAALDLFKQQKQTTKQRVVLEYKVKSTTRPTSLISLEQPRQSYKPNKRYAQNLSIDFTQSTGRLPKMGALTINEQRNVSKPSSTFKIGFDLGTGQRNRSTQRPDQAFKPLQIVQPKIDIKTGQDFKTALDTGQRQRTRQVTETRKQRDFEEPFGFIIPKFEKGRPSKVSKGKKGKKTKRSYRGTPSLSFLGTGFGVKLTKGQKKGRELINPLQIRAI